MTLPFDIARCEGFKNNPLCQMCRRTERGCQYRQTYLIIEKEPKKHCELQILNPRLRNRGEL